MGRAAELMSVIGRCDAKTKLLLVIIVAAGLRIIFFAPYVKTDDIAYIQGAHFLATQQTIDPSHWGTRLGLIGPTAVLYALFGVNGMTTGAYPLLCSLLQVPVVYFVGRRLFGEPSGLLAATLLAFFPLEVIFASHLFPCSPIGLWAGLSCMFAVCQPSKRTGLNLLAAGGCIGIACTVRATAVFCLPLLLISTVWPGGAGRRRGVSIMFHWLCVLAGLATIFAVEAAVFYWLTDEWCYRWRVLSQQVVHQGGEVVGAGTTLGWYLRPITRLLTEQEMALFPLLLAPAIVYHVCRRPGRHSRFLAAWALFVLVYTFYGTVSPLRFAPLPRLPRYLSPATLPAMVLLASFLFAAFGRRWRAVLVALLLASGVLGVWLDNGRAVAADTRELYAYMTDRPGQRFILTPPVLFDVLFYHGFEPPLPLAVYAAPPDERCDRESSRRLCCVYPKRGTKRRLSAFSAQDSEDRGKRR